MGFGWRKRKTALNRQRKGDVDAELVIPNHFRCPISLDLMKDPVTLSSGITYDRESIDKWLESGNFTCPVTNQVLRSFDQIPNHTLRKMIQEWCVENRKLGAERIPTPRVPVSGIEVSEIIFGVKDSAKRLDRCGCLDLVKKIKTWGNESERNRRCIVQNGTGSALALAFDEFAKDSFERNEIVLEEILCCLNWMLPFDAETQNYLGSKDSLGCLVWFLRNGGSNSVKQNSIVALKELVNIQRHVEALAAIEGVGEILFKFIQHPISTKITKSSLILSFQLISFNDNIRKQFVQMGLVSLLIESMIDNERSICERALGVLDRLCDCNEGREEAYRNALTIPVLVKKILRVSDLASEFSISTIWKLIKHEQKKNNGDGSMILVEALQVGAFQKVLLLLQLGCGDETKEKATEVLKSMNPYRTTLECIETADFKNLKRSF